MKFRKLPQELSELVAEVMIKKHDFFDDVMNPSGKGFVHKYHSQIINGDQVVADDNSGLIWQQSISEELMSHSDAISYVNGLNARKFAGYNDWRLPTLEEAMSLMEPIYKSNGLFIDPVFDGPGSIRTCDRAPMSFWIVSFSTGKCIYHYSAYDVSLVQAVRSL